MARQDFLNAEEIVNRLNEAFTKHNAIIEKNAKSMKTLMAEYSKLPSDYLKAQREIQDVMQQQAKTEQDLLDVKIKAQQLRQEELKTAKAISNASKETVTNKDRERLAELKLQKDRENAFDKYEEQLKKREKIEKKSIADSEKAIAQKEKEFAKFEKEFNKYEADLKKKEIAEAKAALATQKNKEKERLAEIKLQQAREKSFDNYEKKLAKEAAELSKAENLYNKIQQKVNGLTQTYNNLAAKKELGLKLSGREESQLRSLEGRLNKYQNVLKTVDSKVGKYGRNVGNYASGFNGLANSINQLSREAPAFANSMQTGFMALSNNIPSLFDEIGRLKAQNAELAASGEEPVSILEQLTDATFSWQTAMSLGVTILTVYGADIVDFAKDLFKVDDANKALKQSTADLDAIRVESLKSITQERIELESNLKVAADTTLSYKEREIAAQKVLDQYPYWFESLGKEAILNGKVEQAVKGVNDALLARARSAAATTKLTENQSKIIDYEEEILKIQEKIVSAERRVQAARIQARAASSVEAGNDAEINALKDIENYNEDIADVKKEINTLDEINNRLLGYAIENRKKSIGLEYSPEAKKEKEKRILEIQDFEAKRAELIRLRLENEAAMNQRTLDDDETNYQRREQAAQKYHEIQRKLTEDALAEQLRVLQKERDAEISEIEGQIKEQEITEKNGRAVIYSLKKKYDYDYLIAYENYAEGLRNIDISIEQSLKGVYDQINFKKAQNLIDQKDLEDTEKYADKIKELVETNEDYRKIEEANKEFQIANRDITKRNAQLAIDEIQREIDKLKDLEPNVQKRLELNNQLIKAKRALKLVIKEEGDAQEEALKKMQTATESYLDKFKDSFLNDFGFGSVNPFLKIEENGKTAFANLMAGANTASEKFAVAFTTVASIAKDTFAFLNQNSQAYFDNQAARLDRQKETQLKYAGESEAGRAEIERQYEEKRRELRIREAKSQKEQALFNIILNTAQGVTAALASVPPNIPLSIAIGILGAAQAAVVASRPIPAYADGTDNHPGGLMLVNDAKGSNYKEVAEFPDGSIHRPKGRNVLMNAPKGTIVHKSNKAFDDSLNALLMQNSIAPFASVMFRDTFGSVNNNTGLTKSDMREVMSEAVDRLGGTKTFHVDINESGFNSYWRESGNVSARRDNRRIVKGKGF